MAIPTVEEQKKRQVDSWKAAAGGYAKHVVEGRMLQGLYERFADRLVPVLRGRAGVRILDIASASGEPAATLAQALPEASLVATDLAEEYLEMGRARVERLKLSNVTFQAADAEDLSQFETASFDVVTVSLGIMFMPSHEKALREFRRLLKPGGHLALAVWASAEDVGFFKTMMDVAREYDPEGVPAATASIATRFADPQGSGLLRQLEEAGFSDVQLGDVQVTFALPSDWWTCILEMPLPIKPALLKHVGVFGPAKGVFEEAHARLEALLRERGFLQPDGSVVSPNNKCWFITAHA